MWNKGITGPHNDDSLHSYICSSWYEFQYYFTFVARAFSVVSNACVFIGMSKMIHWSSRVHFHLWLWRYCALTNIKHAIVFFWFSWNSSFQTSDSSPDVTQRDWQYMIVHEFHLFALGSTEYTGCRLLRLHTKKPTLGGAEMFDIIRMRFSIPSWHENANGVISCEVSCTKTH